MAFCLAGNRESAPSAGSKAPSVALVACKAKLVCVACTMSGRRELDKRTCLWARWLVTSETFNARLCTCRLLPSLLSSAVVVRPA